MDSLWEKVKKEVSAGASVAAEKAGELSRVGKIKMDIAGVKRDINKTFAELGGFVYHLLAREKAPKVVDQEEVKRLLEQMKTLEVNLQTKEAELEAIRSRGKEEEKKENAGGKVSEE